MFTVSRAHVVHTLALQFTAIGLRKVFSKAPHSQLKVVSIGHQHLFTSSPNMASNSGNEAIQLKVSPEPVLSSVPDEHIDADKCVEKEAPSSEPNQQAEDDPNKTNELTNGANSSRRFKRSRRRGRLHKRQLENAEGETANTDGDSKKQKTSEETDNLQNCHNETDWYIENGLRKIYPYQYTYLCYCKGRWQGRRLLEVLSNEFMSTTTEIHKAQIENGNVKVNGKQVKPDHMLRGTNELISNMVHRHELPITAQPIKIVADTDDYLAVDKPSSVPVHPCGRYRHNSIVFMLSRDHGFHHLRTLYRLDRLTSGLLIFGKNYASTNRVMQQIQNREVSKTYLCRVDGEFPQGVVECKEPLDKVHPKIGTWRVKEGGKPSHTTFERVNYNGTSSVVKCYPHTGRTHQIRVHLQYLGHPILNDPLYNDDVWGPDRGKAGQYAKSNEQLYEDLLVHHSTKLFEESSLGEADPMDDSVVTSVENGGSPKVSLSLNQDNDSHSLRLTPNPNCDYCRQKYKDPSPEKLVMFLHALSYQGPGWQFSTDEPEWSKESWNSDTENT